MTKITDTMMGELNYGLASAMAWIYFAAIAVMLLVSVGITIRWVYNYE